MLVYYEICAESRSAIIREKQIKNMSRQNKIELIRQKNPTMRDLYEDIAGMTKREYIPSNPGKTVFFNMDERVKISCKNVAHALLCVLPIEDYI